LTRFIGENSEAESRLLREAVLPIAGKGPNVTWDESRLTPYADAVFNETLRLAPPVGDDIRICVGDDVWPSGIKVRDGTRIVIANVAIGRDPFLWENPEKFNPERWMSYDENGIPAPVKRVDEFVHPVFYSGRRLCLGKDMARFETIVFTTKLFSRFKILPQPLKDDTMSTGPVIFLKEGSYCRIERR
jgi:cytochrome P450